MKKWYLYKEICHFPQEKKCGAKPCPDGTQIVAQKSQRKLCSPIIRSWSLFMMPYVKTRKTGKSLNINYLENPGKVLTRTLPVLYWTLLGLLVLYWTRIEPLKCP